MRRAVSLFFLATLFVFLLPLTVNAAAITPTAGGAGGTRFDRTCGEGEVLAGVSGKAGLWIDRVVPLCVKLSDNKSQWAGDPRPLAGTGGNPPPPAQTFQAICASGQAVGGFSGKQGQYIDRLTIECRQLDRGVLTGPVFPEASAGSGLGGTPFGPHRCSDNRPATGLFGQSGIYVDRLGLKCIPDSVWRPVFHFSPNKGWMNDPAGLVFLNGLYHLHYQAIPGATSFSVDDMTWAHAVSSNLVDWIHKSAVFKLQVENALPGIPDKLAPFTGSAVALSGQQSQVPPCSCGAVSTSCIAAVFTRSATPDSSHSLRQNQVLSTSCNSGESYNTPGVPVLTNPKYPDPRGLNFRDPRVFRFEGTQANKFCHATNFWIMVLAVGDRINLFCSRTLTQWTLMSELIIYGPTDLAGPFVETPDLVPLQVEGSNERLWVMLFAEGFIPPGACRDFFPPHTLTSIVLNDCENKVLANYSKSFYLVGTFDGSNFDPITPGSAPFRNIARELDAGPDFYAPQTWIVPTGIPTSMSLATPTPIVPNIGSVAVSPPIGIQSRGVPDEAWEGTVQDPASEEPAPGESDITSRGLSYATQMKYILGGWESNWRYAHALPTMNWRGHLAIPRELGLVKDGTSTTLTQRPTAYLQGKRSPTVQGHVRNLTVSQTIVPVAGWRSTAYEALATIDVGSAASVVVHVRARGTVQEATVGWRRQIDPGSLRIAPTQTIRDASSGQLTTFVSGEMFLRRPANVYGAGGSPPVGFAGEWREPLRLQGGKLKLHLLIDRSSVEAFANDGRVVMSGVMFPDPENTELQISSTGGPVVVESLDLYEIQD